jgi:hypothetical protein
MVGERLADGKGVEAVAGETRGRDRVAEPVAGVDETGGVAVPGVEQFAQ